MIMSTLSAGKGVRLKTVLMNVRPLVNYEHNIYN